MTDSRDGLLFHYPDQLEYDSLYEEIFKQRTYYVDLDTNTPLIVDCGAHIGMTTLYLHKLYPHATFICIEPDPRNLSYLTQNLAENQVENVTIVPKAVVGKFEKRKTIPFYASPRLGVFSSIHTGGWTGDQEGSTVEVETTTLSSYLTKPVDLLKIDIEGMETEVIWEAQYLLHNVRHVMIEFHRTANHPEDKILRLLKNAFKTVEVTVDERKERNRKNQLLFIEATKE